MYIMNLHEVHSDRPERHDYLSRLLLLNSPFLFPLFLGGKRKGENNEIKKYSCIAT